MRTVGKVMMVSSLGNATWIGDLQRLGGFGGQVCTFEHAECVVGSGSHESSVPNSWGSLPEDSRRTGIPTPEHFPALGL